LSDQALKTKTVNASNPGDSVFHNHHGNNKAEQINIINADNVDMGGFKNEIALIDKIEEKYEKMR